MRVSKSFSALQRAENSSILVPEPAAPTLPRLSVLFSEPKIPQLRAPVADEYKAELSVLFSEPKIPQSFERYEIKALNVAFSALQRAENSSISRKDGRLPLLLRLSVLFSEPKIPQSKMTHITIWEGYPFSALQRAENSSMEFEGETLGSAWAFSALQRAENSSIATRTRNWGNLRRFQCSSASRKFLNQAPTRARNRYC